MTDLPEKSGPTLPMVNCRECRNLHAALDSNAVDARLWYCSKSSKLADPPPKLKDGENHWRQCEVYLRGSPLDVLRGRR